MLRENWPGWHVYSVTVKEVLVHEYPAVHAYTPAWQSLYVNCRLLLCHTTPPVTVVRRCMSTKDTPVLDRECKLSEGTTAALHGVGCQCDSASKHDDHFKFVALRSAVTYPVASVHALMNGKPSPSHTLLLPQRLTELSQWSTHTRTGSS